MVISALVNDLTKERVEGDNLRATVAQKADEIAALKTPPSSGKKPTPR